MKIIVLIKQVPNTREIKIDKKKGTLIREGVESIINPEDLNGIEAALQLVEKFKGKITVISMGPPQAIEAIQEALSMGVDDAILLTDKAFAGADTLATSYTLSKCIEKVSDYDLIICGRQAIDGDTAQIGPQIAEYLDIPQITYVKDFEIINKKIVAKREVGDNIEKIEANLPALITVTKELNIPRYPKIDKIMDVCSKKANIKFWNAADIKTNADDIGLRGSPTSVIKTFSPKNVREGEIIEGSKQEIADKLIVRLKAKNLI